MPPNRPRFAALLALACLLSAMTGRAATVKIDFDREQDFATYRTWAFGDTEWMRGLVEKDRFVDGYVRTALRRGLTARGLGEVPADEADLLVTFEGSRARRLEIDEHDTGPPSRWRWSSSDIDVRSYDEGTLIVDLTDRERGLLVWRGWVIDTVIEGKARERRIDKGIGKLLRKYPPPAAPSTK